jgi:hypothetical protein
MAASSQDIPLGQQPQETQIDDHESEQPEEKEVVCKDAFLLKTVEELGKEALCYQCGQKCEVSRCILKTKSKASPDASKYVCKQCNACSVMLNRHLQWPPAEFSSLSQDDQEEFWKSCHETADPAGRFKYELIRATLIKRMSFRMVHEQSAEEWSEPKPLAVWEKEGWDRDMIEKQAKKTWNSVAGWLFEVPIVRKSRKVTLQEIEERINASEQAIKAKAVKGSKATFMEESEESDEPKRKKARKGSSGSDAASQRKQNAEVRKHNAKQQALANKAMNYLAKPVEEIKQAYSLASKNADSMPPLLLEHLKENHEKLVQMLKDATAVVKAAPNAIAKDARLETIAWDLKQVGLAVGETRSDVKQFNALAKALKLS